MTFSRRTALQIAGASALPPAALTVNAAQVPAPPKESAGTPKIAISMGDSGLFGGRGTSATDPVEVCRYFASRDRINHVHYRNVIVIRPYERYREVWIDEGMNNMFAVMKELVKNKYTHLIYPEHPRRLDYDSERGTNRRISGWRWIHSDRL